MLFAACHVLLRRLVPWHPPCALVRLILLRMTSSVIVDPETNYNLLPSGSIATGLLRLSLVFSTSNVRLSRCVPVFAGPDSRSSWYYCQVFQLSGQGSFQSLENDTELRQQFLLEDFPSLLRFRASLRILPDPIDLWMKDFPFGSSLLPRKEVIQPHLPIRLPCYDFTPVIDLTLGCWLLAVTSQLSGAINSHGVTGGVYKARERIHRGMLIRDY